MVKKPSKPTEPKKDPESEQKQHLKTLAIANRLLTLHRSPATNTLTPSATAFKLDGHDLTKRGAQRKTRFLFSFPGLMGHLSAGRVGELADLGSKNPVLYMEFPNGRMKLFGTHVYPTNKYLTMQLTKSAKGVQCEDCFESLIVFSEAWWIGSKKENPEEHKLEFPNHIRESEYTDLVFKGGAGATFEEPSSVKKPIKENKGKSPSPKTETDEDMDEDSLPLTGKSMKNILETTPVRHSARMAGKTLNYADSSGNDSIDSEEEKSETDDKINVKTEDKISVKTEDKISVKTEVDNAFNKSISCELGDPIPTTSSPGKEKKIEQSLSLSKSGKSKENPPSKRGTLVQPSLSTLFAKAAENKSKRGADTSPEPKGSGAKRQHVNSVKITEKNQVKGSNKKESSSGGKRSGSKTASVKKQIQVIDDDEPDEISSDSQDDSDEDWAA